MGLISRLFGARGSSQPKAKKPSERVLKEIQELELQVCCSDVTEITDKDLKLGITAAEKLRRIGGKAALVALQSATNKIGYGHPTYRTTLPQVVDQCIDQVTKTEVKRQGGRRALRTYKRMKATADEYFSEWANRPSPVHYDELLKVPMEQPVALFDAGLDLFFGTMGIPDSLAFLQKSLASENTQLRYDTALELGRLGRTYSELSTQIMGMLSQCLSSDMSPKVRSAVAQSLGWLRRPEALSNLLPALADSDLSVRKSVVKACRYLLGRRVVSKVNNPYSTQEMGLLKQSLAHPDTDIQEFAAEQLLKVGGLDVIEQVLENHRPVGARTRQQAALRLGGISDERAVLMLVRMLEDPDGFVRVKAAQSLGRIGDLSVIDTLSGAVSSLNEDVRCHIVDAIAEIRQRHEKT